MALSKIDVANMLTGLVPNDNTIRRPNAKPLIINGNMAVAQKATSVTSLTSSGAVQTVDRIKNEISNIGTYTVIQESLSSGEAYNNGFRKAWRIDCTSADASPAAGDNLYVTYHFEGQDLQLFKKGTSNAQKFTLAFWIKSNKTGTGQVNLRDNDNSRLIGGTYTISRLGAISQRMTIMSGIVNSLRTSYDRLGIEIAATDARNAPNGPFTVTIDGKLRVGNNFNFINNVLTFTIGDAEEEEETTTYTVTYTT